MKKLIVYLSLVLVAIVMATVYGAIQNQISWTLSSEYFSEFKFYQFGYANSELPGRLLASIVGIRASWWMGFPIGLLAGLPGFIHADHREMLAISFRSFIAALLFTFLFSLGGLMYGYLATVNLDIVSFGDWYLPVGLGDPRRFICAGFMHNSAYLGGGLSITIAWAYHVSARLKKQVKRGRV